MEARFSGCVVATHWLPHTLVQIFFCLVLVHKKVWCSLSSLSIQTGVLVVTFCITLLCLNLSYELYLFNKKKIIKFEIYHLNFFWCSQTLHFFLVIKVCFF